jgi:purine-nucleoside phosphorylase
MSEPYDPELLATLRASAQAAGLRLEEGVYGAVLGPSYETAAEVRMLERLGVDAVGMSTVPESIAALALGMRVAGISCITNPAAGIAEVRLEHADVLRTAARAAEALERVIRGFVARV